MKTSAIIVSYNVAAHLRRALTSLGEVAEIIVVDNASSDDSADVVRREFPTATLLAEGKNRGFSAAVNLGAKRATGDVLLVLNPDTVVPEGGVPAMERALQAHPAAGVVGFRQVDEAGGIQLSVGPPPSLALELGRKVVQRRLDAGDPFVAWGLERLLRRPRRVPWVSGAAMLVRREAFAAAGGFDERFFLYFEDIDFCLRVAAAGFEIWFDPSVTLTHTRGASARTHAAAAARAYRDSQVYFWRKHRGAAVAAAVHAYLRWRGVAPEQLQG